MVATFNITADYRTTPSSKKKDINCPIINIMLSNNVVILSYLKGSIDNCFPVNLNITIYTDSNYKKKWSKQKKLISLNLALLHKKASQFERLS